MQTKGFTGCARWRNQTSMSYEAGHDALCSTSSLENWEQTGQAAWEREHSYSHWAACPNCLLEWSRTTGSVWQEFKGQTGLMGQRRWRQGKHGWRWSHKEGSPSRTAKGFNLKWLLVSQGDSFNEFRRFFFSFDRQLLSKAVECDTGAAKTTY